jgi:hypothetical protein
MTAAEDVFAGPAIELAARPSSKVAQISFRSVDDDDQNTISWAQPTAGLSTFPPDAPGAVRHAAGYGRFLDSVLAHDADPRTLAGDPLELLRFLRAHGPDVVADPELRRAAGIFLGNCIASLRADALWRRDDAGPSEVGAGRRSFVPEMILERLTLPLAPSDDDSDAQLQSFVASLHEWVEEADDDALPPPPLPTPRPEASGAPRFVCPELPSTVILDKAGQPIVYGSRWGPDGPPEDSYSVDLHPERFAGLHTVAHALIAHVERVYDVDVSYHGAPDAAATLLHPRAGVLELVRVVPRDPEAAPLLFVFTGYPGVIVEAGVLHAFPYPICGCEACDETVERQAIELEQLVLSVAAGGYAEHYPVGRRRELRYGLVTLDASGTETGSHRGGGGEPTGLSAEQLERGEAALAALPHGWRPWPHR